MATKFADRIVSVDGSVKLPHTSEIHKSLLGEPGLGLSAMQCEAVARHLGQHGFAVDDGLSGALQASMRAQSIDQRTANNYRMISRMMARAGLDYDGGPVNLGELDRALKESRFTLDEKMWLKTALAQVGSLA